MNDYHCTVFQNGTATFMARIRNFNGDILTPDKVDSISYSVYLLELDDPSKRTAVRGHQNVALNPAETLFSQLQQNANWTPDDTGYNFLWTLNVKTSNAFQYAGRHYLAEVKLTSDSVPFLIRYRLYVI